MDQKVIIMKKFRYSRAAYYTPQEINRETWRILSHLDKTILLSEVLDNMSTKAKLDIIEKHHRG